MKAKKIPLLAGCVILSFFLFVSLFPGLMTPYGPKEMFEVWQKPSSSHILGCNDMGYDIYTELVYGAGDTLFVGLLSAVFSVILGTLIGILSTLRGFAGKLFLGIIQIFAVLPKMILLIVLAAFFGRTRWTLILLISLFSWVGCAREVSAKVMKIKGMPFMAALKVSGYSPFHITLFHLIPNLRDILFTRFLLGMTSAVMMESTLSFIGLGDLYHPSWGTMMSFAYKRGAFFRGAYIYLLAPGICIALISLSIYLISTYFEEKRTFVKENY